MNTRTLLTRYLQQLQLILEKIQNTDNESEQLLTARISPDMLPLSKQVQITANFSLRIACQEAGQEVVNFDANELNYKGLSAQLKHTLAHISALPEPNHGGQPMASDKAGFADIKMPFAEYRDSFALPNFFFHLSMVYAIAKAQGVAVTKGDFDGHHQYPEGFSWEV